MSDDKEYENYMWESCDTRYLEELIEGKERELECWDKFTNGQITEKWNKIYTDKERELLWLQMLDKKERYVCGERIDISNGSS